MADVGVRVTLEGLAEAKRGLGTLEEGLEKLAARSPENARKLAEVTAAVAGIGAEHEDMASKVEDANARIGNSSKQVTDLQDKQAEAAARLQEAYEKMVAAGTAPTVGATGVIAGVKQLAPEAPAGILTTRESSELLLRQNEEMRKGHLATKNLDTATVELSKDVQVLLDKYDPLGAKLRKLTADQEAFRNALSGGMKGVSDETVVRVEKGLQTEIDRTKEAMVSGSKAAEEHKGIMDDVGSSLASLALRYVAPIALVQQLVSVMMEANVAGREAELQNIKLNAVLQATGMVAGFTGTQLDKMADAMQESTAIDSERIKQAITVLLTFKNVQGDMFERALKLGTDYARLYGGDVASAVRLVGRAFEDPERGMTMLTRTIGTLSEAQRKMIKEMSESGDLLGAQGKLAEILEGKMKDVAKAIGDSAVSVIDRFKNSWSDLMKELAKSSEDPTGAGGNIYGAMTKGLKKFTEVNKEFREWQMREELGFLKERLESGELNQKQMTALQIREETLRKALSIKTEYEIAAEKEQMQASQNAAFDENLKKFWKDNLDKQVKQIDNEIALGRKTAKDKENLMRYMAQQETNTETERLDFLAKSLQAKKEGQKFTQAQIDGEVQLNTLVSKGMTERINSQLALGEITKVQAEERKTEQALIMNEVQQQANERALAITSTYSLEYRSLVTARQRLQVERDLIKARGGEAVDIAKKAERKAEFDLEVKAMTEIDNLRSKANQVNESAATSFFMSQSEKIKKMELEATLIGKTTVQREIALGLYDLEQQRISAIGKLVFDNAANYRTNLELINKTFKDSKEKLPALIEANQKASDEVTEFWRKAAESMQQSMSSLFFDFMQGKIGDLAGSFKRTIDQLVANFLAAKASTALFGSDFGKGGGIGGEVGGLFNLGKNIFGGMFGGAGTQMPAPVVEGVASWMAPGFAEGTDFVPRDMLARVHKGEQIVPASDNRGRGNINVTNIFTVSGQVDRRSQAQIAAAAGEGVRKALARNT